MSHLQHIAIHMNTDKTEFMCFKREGAISTLSGKPLKLVDKSTHPGSNISSTESDVNIRQAKTWTNIDWLSIMWKSVLSDKIKQDFFQAMAMWLLLFWCTIWTLPKLMEKRLDENYATMLRADLNKWQKQHPIKQQRYNHLPPIS